MAPEHVPSAGADRLRASLIAVCVTVVAFCAGDAVARQYPFGPKTRDVNDLGNQFVPFHAHLWDLLHGKADGGWLLNWQSGYGTSFLPDFGTYLSSPFAPLVALFPRDQIDLAVYVVTVLKLGAAAAAMACLLLALRPGPRWAAGMLGASYALCGWTMMLASYNPMWLDGLIAFPLLCMVGEWARQGRRPILGIAVVAVCWTANFYTAYMATLGATLVLVARLITETPEPGRPAGRARLWVLGRAALTTVLGIGLTAPLLLTIVKGTKLAYPGLQRTFVPLPWTDMLVRLLPGTYGFSSPSTYVDTGALLLAFVLPFHPAVERRTRTVWTVLAVAVAASFEWRPTHLVWHAFTTPNGSPYRQTFVLSGILVIAAWLTVSHGLPARRPLAYGVGVMGAVTAVAAIGADSGLAGLGTYPLLAFGMLVSVAALVHLRRVQNGGALARGVPAGVAVGVLLLAQAGQLAASNAWIDAKRLAAMDDYPVWGDRQSAQRSVIDEADGWPRYRTDPGRSQTVGNDPLAVGGQGAQYYSSLTPDVWTNTLVSLGGGWTSRGRSVQSLDNPVTDVIFSVGARLHSPENPDKLGTPEPGVRPTVTRQAVPPLVTVHADADAGYGHSPYRNQELLLGSKVYDSGSMTVYDGAGHKLHPEAGGTYRTPGDAPDRRLHSYRVDSSCPVGSQVYFWAPDFRGSVRIDGAGGAAPVSYLGGLPSHRAPVQLLGDTPAGGHLSLRLNAAAGRFSIDSAGIGCLSPSRLAAAERRLATTGATDVHITADGVRARLPRGSYGSAVIAAPAITGWSCSVGGAPAQPAQPYLGLVSAPLADKAAGADGTLLDCTFSPPGLHQGEAIGAAAFAGVLAVAACTWWRRRKGDRPAGEVDAVASAAPDALPEEAII
jgi:hypothetical protein